MSGPTWDGLLAFLGGLLAFVAILIQVHFANKGLRTQLDNEKKTRESASNGRRRAITGALRTEILGFARSYNAVAEERLKQFDLHKQNVLDVGFPVPHANPFPVFFANAYVIGEYPEKLAESVVSFYQAAESFLIRLSEFHQIRTEFYRSQHQQQASLLAGSAMKNIRDELPNVGESISNVLSAVNQYLSPDSSR